MGTVTFRPNHGAIASDSAAGSNEWQALPHNEMPDLVGTVINPITHKFSSNMISPGSAVTLDILVWTLEDKVVYGDHVSALPNVSSVDLTRFVYDMQVTLFCRTPENKPLKFATPWTPVEFADFNNCS